MKYLLNVEARLLHLYEKKKSKCNNELPCGMSVFTEAEHNISYGYDISFVLDGSVRRNYISYSMEGSREGG